MWTSTRFAKKPRRFTPADSAFSFSVTRVTYKKLHDGPTFHLLNILIFKLQDSGTCPSNNNHRFHFAMSSNIQEVQDFIQQLSSTIKNLPDTDSLAARPTFTALLSLISPSATVSPEAIAELLTQWVSRIQVPAVNVIKVRSTSFRS